MQQLHEATCIVAATKLGFAIKKAEVQKGGHIERFFSTTRSNFLFLREEPVREPSKNQTQTEEIFQPWLLFVCERYSEAWLSVHFTRDVKQTDVDHVVLLSLIESAPAEIITTRELSSISEKLTKWAKSKNITTGHGQLDTAELASVEGAICELHEHLNSTLPTSDVVSEKDLATSLENFVRKHNDMPHPNSAEDTRYSYFEKYGHVRRLSGLEFVSLATSIYTMESNDMMEAGEEWPTAQQMPAQFVMDRAHEVPKGVPVEKLIHKLGIKVLPRGNRTGRTLKQGRLNQMKRIEHQEADSNGDSKKTD